MIVSFRRQSHAAFSVTNAKTGADERIGTDQPFDVFKDDDDQFATMRLWRKGTFSAVVERQFFIKESVKAVTELARRQVA